MRVVPFYGVFLRFRLLEKRAAWAGSLWYILNWRYDGKLLKFFSQIVADRLGCRCFMSAFIISLPALERNALILRDVADAAGCRIALALKGFSCWPCFEALSPWLDGCCASGLWEARLARRRFGKHVLTYSPGHAPEEIAELAEISSHLDFNSLTQWSRFREEVMRHPRFVSGELKCGLRVNPQCSTGHTPMYDPCAPGSRLGVTPDMIIDLHDYNTMRPLVEAIIRHENGRGPLKTLNSWYSAEVIDEGMRRAGVVKPVTAVKAVPVTKETAGATVTAGIGIAQLADVMPQISVAMDKAQGHITSGDTVRIIFGIATIVVAGFIAWSQVRKHQAGVV